MQEWLLKLLISYAAKWLINRIGHTETAKHMEEAVLKYTPLPPHNPSPAEIRNPHKTWQMQD